MYSNTQNYRWVHSIDEGRRIEIDKTDRKVKNKYEKRKRYMADGQNVLQSWARAHKWQRIGGEAEPINCRRRLCECCKAKVETNRRHEKMVTSCCC